MGMVWTVYEVAKRLGVQKALRGDFSGKLALWQVIAGLLTRVRGCLRYAWRRYMRHAMYLHPAGL
ncbi:MAG: hypothetical protein JRI22_23265 [Deltaproteobacteria bacterium]|nr:hypothetical protein [Deltaproteobacteria bacterium]